MIYLLRHGERSDQSKDNNEKDTWVNSHRYKTNLYDIPLSLNGIKIAYSHLKTILISYKGNFDFIYCSPMTRCVQTALQFQLYIKNKYNQISLIRIEYGLSIHMFKEKESYFMESNVKLVEDKFTVIKMFEFVDKYLDKNKIYKRYGSKFFDTNYNSVMTREQVNLEQNYTESINSRINTLKQLGKLIDKSKITLICVHCETCYIILNYLNKKWISPLNAPTYGFIGGLKIGVKSNKLIYLDTIKGI